MNALEILVRIRKIVEDMVKETFIVKALKEGSIMSLSTEDIINLYPYNAYDYRVDGKNIDYIITEDSVTLLADLAKINNWSIDNIKYAEFNDCLSISVNEGVLSVTCKDKTIREGERVAYVDKMLMRRYGIEIKLRNINGEQIAPLEKLFERLTSIDVESLITLPIYFVINPTHLGLDVLADTYIYLLTKGLNRVPTNTDAAEYLINNNKLNDNYIKAYVLKEDIDMLKEYFDIKIDEKDHTTEYLINGEYALTVSTVQGSINPNLLKITWINLETLKINGIGINLIDLGSTNVLDCSEMLIEKMKQEFRGIL
ncbi:hypothetical protein [Vulcanisaeta sp. JCM 16159]|uniref:hypothetical protein n=1 Tax=Vulcanisaeta sp. JCM 16159 TaxID=1295371 RepID=UPI0006CFD286|nr:hypothetical protein [Vulcanisaeta sp. JCM 16159]